MASFRPLRMRPAVVLLACGMALSLAGASKATLNLKGHIVPGPGTMSDVWGWVDPATGKEYAIVGELNDKHVWIVDATNPSNPTVVATIDNVPGFDFKTWQHYLYLVDGSPAGASAIYDISDPTNPQRAGTKFAGAHNIFIDDKGYLYLEQFGLRIYDLNPNPVQPTLIFNKPSADGHDCMVVGDRLYDFHGAAGTFIYDVTDRSQPVELAHIDDSGIIFHHSGWTSRNERFLYINDELATGSRADFTVWDIRDVSQPVKVRQHKNATATVHNSYRVGNYLYVAYYSAGLEIFDVSTARNPQLVDVFDTSPLTGEGYKGAFGVYPFTPSGNVYVSDMQSGFYIFSFQPPASAVLISSFAARYDDGRVMLEWSIAAADELEGFNIYRAAGDDTPFLKLNDTLLPAGGAYRFADDDIGPGDTYTYVLGAVDRDGEFMSERRRVTVPESGLVLHPSYPNPFNPTTTLSYTLPAAGEVSLTIYDGLGRRVRTLVDRYQPAGRHDAVWDATDDAGARVASGVYFSRLVTPSGVASNRMILLK